MREIGGLQDPVSKGFIFSVLEMDLSVERQGVVQWTAGKGAVPSGLCLRL